MSELVIDDPYHLTEVTRRQLADSPTVERLLTDAAQAQTAWMATSLSDRQALCEAAVAHMEANADTIAPEITRMMGKPLAQARGELKTMAARARHMISIAEAELCDQVIAGRDSFERRIERVPLGVVFNMPAWNYPLLTCVNALVPAILAGNAVLLKHSSRTALCGEHFQHAFDASGAPSGLVQALHCSHATAAQIIGDARVGYVAFTGSVNGGHAVYRAAAQGGFIDAGLELGGKDPAYVAEDADLERAVANLVDGACYNAGQSCCGVERVYVHASLYDTFIEQALGPMEKYVLGDPLSEGTTMGPMAQANAAPFLAEQVQGAVRAGAKLLCGGEATTVDGKGRFFLPTLISDVSHDLDVMRTESFGPILPVMRVGTDEEALELMNDSDLGLTASVFTSDRDRAANLARRLEAGTVFMNQCDVLDPALPWTGVKDSGKGSTLSALGFQHLTRPRSINFKLG